MSEKKSNDILEEQRKARQQFLELKKMQHGEMEAPPKPSEVAIMPKTPKEKWDNFWFQYKWYVIVSVISAIVLAVLITQCATRTSYDYEVVYFTYSPVLDEQTALVGDYIEKFADDINGDGEVNVQIINCSFSNKQGSNRDYQNTMLTKLQSLIAADHKALLFITDEKSREYLNGISEGGLLEGEPITFNEDFYKSTKTDYASLPEDIAISCRRVSDTVLEDKKGVEEVYTGVQKILTKLKESV